MEYNIKKINLTVYKFNLKKDLIKLKEEIIKECLISEPKNKINCNYELNTKYKNKLYNLFLNKCRKILNKFTLSDNNFKCWCYLSNKFFKKTMWHNHLNTCTINGVIYLKLCKNEKGIDFKYNKKIINIIPKELDLLIFPNYLNHLPYPSKTKDTRISINLELRCKEPVEKIFNLI